MDLLVLAVQLEVQIFTCAGSTDRLFTAKKALLGDALLTGNLAICESGLS